MAEVPDSRMHYCKGLMPKVRLLAMDLLSHLQDSVRGRENAVPLSELAQWYGVGWRMVARAIELLRQQGYPIGTSRSKPYGAYWPVTDEDYEAAVRPFYAAACSMMQTFWRLTKRVPGRVLDRLRKDTQLDLFEASRDQSGMPPRAPNAERDGRAQVESVSPAPALCNGPSPSPKKIMGSAGRGAGPRLGVEGNGRRS